MYLLQNGYLTAKLAYTRREMASVKRPKSLPKVKLPKVELPQTKKPSKQEPSTAMGPVSADAVEPAYLLSLKLSSVRCFGPEQTLDLTASDGKPARWTVILGNNGVGKTTLLEALAVMLPELRRSREGDPNGAVAQAFSFIWKRRESGDRPWTRSNAANCSLQLQLSWTDSLEKSPVTDTSSYSHYSQSRPIYPSNLPTGGSARHLKHAAAAVAYACGASRRQGEGALTDEVATDTTATLFKDSATLRNSEEWLLQTDYAASKESPFQARAKKQIQKVTQILVRVLPGVHDVRVVARELPGKQVRAVAEVQTDDGWLPMSALGLGYRTMTAWMVDFASRLFERYPDLEDPLTGSAVCLIDEIDLHLHPRWQRDLIAHLTHLFPQTQFVVTAHSPLVVQAAAGANLVMLRREGDHVVIDRHTESVRNWRLDQILTSELFELPSARPPELDAFYQERDAILAKPELTAADERRLAELRQAIGSRPIGETPEDLEAMDLIRQAARRLKRVDR